MVNEATRTTLFLKYARHFIKYTFAFEAKICKTKTLNFNLVVPHQVANLIQVKHGIFNHKISDAGYTTNPWDGFQLVGEPAYVVIFWYQHRNDKRFTMIDIDVWVSECGNPNVKSISYERASEISYLKGVL